MTGSASRALAAGFVLGVSACAPPAEVAPVAESAVETKAPPPPPKKPVRMNGRGEVSSISISDFFALQQTGQTLLFDARPAFFHTMGHIPGAISLPTENCDAAIEKRETEIKAALADGKTIVVYCTNLLCPDARTVAIHLAGYGYSSSTLRGGWESWKESGLATE